MIHCVINLNFRTQLFILLLLLLLNLLILFWGILVGLVICITPGH